MNRNILARISWCLAPLAAAFLLPPALALWVESHRFSLPLVAAFQSVIADYSRTLGDSLWITTFYQLPPFLLLAAVLAFFSRHLTTPRMATLSLSGLALIFLVQIPTTISTLKDIPEGEAEFIEFRYIFVSVLSILLLSVLLFLRPAPNSNATGNA